MTVLPDLVACLFWCADRGVSSAAGNGHGDVLGFSKRFV
jgi:hypothetical protein